MPSERLTKCPNHTQAIEVYKWPMHVYAGSQMQHTPVPQGALILDLAGGFKPKYQAWGVTLPGANKVIYIDWPDMSVPRLDVNDWRMLAKVMAKEKNVYVACAGGHGRTGTALAILGHFWGCLPKDMDPVDYLRKVYCSEAVETPKQGIYIFDMTGRSVDLKKEWKPYAPVSKGAAPHTSDFRYNIGKDGTVDTIRDMHKQEYKGSYFGNRGGSAADDYTGKREDRSFTLNKKVDSGSTTCDECCAMNNKHFDFCSKGGK
jgi:hypothetical protein